MTRGAAPAPEPPVGADHATRRLGGVLALLGGLGAIVVNVLQPRTPAATEGLLELVASTPQAQRATPRVTRGHR